MLLLTMAFVVMSCEDREIIHAINTGDPMMVDLSTDQLVLDSNYPDTPALTVSWSPAVYSTPTAINYTVQIAADQDFTNPVVLGSTHSSVHTASFSTSQLNAASQELGLQAFVASTLYLRVISFIGTASLPATSNVASVMITPYKLVYPDFYLVGAAAYMGWTDTSAQLLYKQDNLMTIYTYLENNQNFRFLGQQNWSPINYSTALPGTQASYQYFMSTSSNIIQAPGDNENMKFTGPTGIYKVVIDATKGVQSLTAQASPISNFDFPAMYIVGTIDGINWDASKAASMTVVGGGVYTYTTKLDNGSQFKFIGQQSFGDLEWGNIFADGNTGYLGPKNSDGNITFDGGGSTYKITINIKAGIYTIVKQ